MIGFLFSLGSLALPEFREAAKATRAFGDAMGTCLAPKKCLRFAATAPLRRALNRVRWPGAASAISVVL
eukprot:12632025-Alexandrium_andersonii.AAC.1